MARRKGTSTSDFGVGKRESHDASGFYERFDSPKIVRDKDFIPNPSAPSGLFCGDSTDMHQLDDRSVALVVTSPPYFAGKQYETEYEREGVPASYLEYLQMLHDVFEECRRVLEPGGRIAVNVANLGRKPYRSLSADVIHILQDQLGFLLRGEIIWQKSKGSNGNCAWGSYRSAANPVLRDTTERVIVASKGQLDRAMDNKDRAAAGLPHRNTQLTDDFLFATLDVWEIDPESARRVDHPAPFPEELPLRLINLFTYENDLVLDPFLGSGSTAVAAARSGRRFAGYDLDPSYVEIAERRISQLDEPANEPPAKRGRSTLPSTPPAAEDLDFQQRATAEGKAAQKLAADVLAEAGFEISEVNKKVGRTGVLMNLKAFDQLGREWFFDVSGAYTSHRGGLLRTDTVWKTLGRAYALRSYIGPQTVESDDQTRIPLVFLTTNLPRRGSEGDAALRLAGPDAFYDAIDMLSTDGMARLRVYATGGPTAGPKAGFWPQDQPSSSTTR